MSGPSNLQELVRAAKAGEETAWDLLYRQYYPAVYAMALRICGSKPIASDAVQDAFIGAYLKLQQLKDHSSFGGWIRKIATHQCFRALNLYNKGLSIDDLPRATESWWEDELDRKFENLSRNSRLHSALTRIPESLRSALLLRYFSNFNSYENIAAILSVPLGTVRSRLNQAKVKLVEYWDKCGDSSVAVIREMEELNSYYYSLYSSMHREDSYKNKFIQHLHKNIRIMIGMERMVTGRETFENMVADDRRAGSWLEPVNVLSSGNITILEAKHFNSAEYPTHCPPASVAVLYRSGKQVGRLLLHPELQ